MSTATEFNKDFKSSPSYQEELREIWHRHVATTESSVLCESCNSGNSDITVAPAPAPATQLIVKIHIARVYTDKKYCDCPGSEVGKINVDPDAHLLTCKFRRSTKYTSLRVPTGEDVEDGYSLGVAL